MLLASEAKNISNVVANIEVFCLNFHAKIGS